MYTSVMLFALAGAAAPAAVAENLSWQSYGSVQQQAQRQQKPLAVVLGSGRNGWEKLSQSGQLGQMARQLLASRYIPVYVDTTTPEGKRLATAFQMPSGQGIVISDAAGRLQAFWHEGDLSDDNLVTYLERYSDPQRPVSVTDTNPAEHTSLYPSSTPTSVALNAPVYSPNAFQPAFSFGGFGGFGGGCAGGG